MEALQCGGRWRSFNEKHRMEFRASHRWEPSLWGWTLRGGQGMGKGRWGQGRRGGCGGGGEESVDPPIMAEATEGSTVKFAQSTLRTTS